MAASEPDRFVPVELVPVPDNPDLFYLATGDNHLAVIDDEEVERLVYRAASLGWVCNGR